MVIGTRGVKLVYPREEETKVKRKIRASNPFTLKKKKQITKSKTRWLYCIKQLYK